MDPKSAQSEHADIFKVKIDVNGTIASLNNINLIDM